MINNNTVSLTVKLNLCVSCGVCKGICPQNCISWKRRKGMFNPIIDEGKCISCGACLEVCPGLEQKYDNTELQGEQILLGSHLKVCNANSKNQKLRHVSASGGVVSTLINTLLNKNAYDVAFCVDEYNYENQVCSEMVEKEDLKHSIEKSSLPKSRYIAVSHEKAVAFMVNNPEKKVILIGTSCAVRAIESAIDIQSLNRNNYLIIGLFCDKVFNYNIFKYFSNHKACGNRKLELLHFKNKDSGGWPGNMKFIYTDGSHSFVDEVERMKMKEYFVPERCLYCLDKLNVNADISIGDNFTKIASSKLGCNSVIIRTQRGLNSWNTISAEVDEYECDIEEIAVAQDLKGRSVNVALAKQKEVYVKEQDGLNIYLNKGVEIEISSANQKEKWQQLLAKSYMGAAYEDSPDILNRHIAKKAFKKRATDILRLPKELLYRVKLLIINSGK